MKAVILAGGKGIRGKPFTDYFPKAMIPINGKPLVDYVINHLFSFSMIDEIIIISDFNGLGSQIKHYFSNEKRKIKFIQDSGNGTAGDLLNISNSLKKDTEFVLWFVDNLCALDIKKMYQNFKKKNSFCSIATRFTCFLITNCENWRSIFISTTITTRFTTFIRTFCWCIRR